MSPYKPQKDVIDIDSAPDREYGQNCSKWEVELLLVIITQLIKL